MFATGVNVVGVAAVFVVAQFTKAFSAHDFGKAHDGIQGGAQFMADAGQKIGLLPVGIFRHFLGFAQFLLGAFPRGDVAHHGAEGCAGFWRLQTADADEERNTVALAGGGHKFAAIVEHAGEARTRETCEIVPPEFAAFGLQQAGEELACNVGFRHTEDSFGTRRKPQNAAVAVERDDAIGGHIDDGFQFLVGNGAYVWHRWRGDDCYWWCEFDLNNGWRYGLFFWLDLFRFCGCSRLRRDGLKDILVGQSIQPGNSGCHAAEGLGLTRCRDKAQGGTTGGLRQGLPQAVVREDTRHIVEAQQACHMAGGKEGITSAGHENGLARALQTFANGVGHERHLAGLDSWRHGFDPGHSLHRFRQCFRLHGLFDALAEIFKRLGRAWLGLGDRCSVRHFHIKGGNLA